ncbi:putative glycosyl hydrolase 18 family protein [Lyophyllum shimeji]|uniref:chitinase n=1 Tax=Lyophyllum shimeji TaxID=47721 RepID=A0A9P3USM5_LYOSH|nr:putative glycosyl hydrolase 18 family protein [Lyophyllum shimeji]
MPRDEGLPPGPLSLDFLLAAMVFSGRFASILTGCLLVTSQVHRALAYDNSRSDNLAVYYGQNSYGATHSDQSGWQKALSTYCQDDTINAIPLAFLNVYFSSGGMPEINLSNTCSSNGGVFPGTNLANCQSMAADIKACQAKGKIITISLGGATGAASFSSDGQAQTFADTVWNLFLGGSSSTRPFGDAVLDGVDLDIEGGSSTGYVAFVNRIRSHANGASKTYYVTGAPQCPFPDAYLGSVLNSVGFDAVYVQCDVSFACSLRLRLPLNAVHSYNNWCGLGNYNNPNAWNFDTWDNWAKNTSPNKNVKVYIGAPAAPSAAGSGYVDAATLGRIAQETRAKYSSFGGIMLWDASQAYGNGRFDVAVKEALGGSTGTPTPTTNPPRTTSATTTQTTTTTTPGSGGCAGVAAWDSKAVYVGGNTATYNGHLWTAKWWTQGDVPGGPANVWMDGGACFATAATAGADAAATPVAAAVVTAVAESSSSKPESGISKPSTAPAGQVYQAASTVKAEGANLRRENSRFFRL